MFIPLPQKGARVGAYEIIEQLGQGGSGHVYKAEREGHYYAVKILNTLDWDGWTRREVTALVNLPLPNVVRFIGYDWWPNAEMGYPCIIMEHVSGLALDLYALRYNPSTRRALTIFLKVAQALREVFQLGVLHRDIKEPNIIIRAHDGEPVLIDFGFSSVAGARTVTGPGRLPPGTPEYRSPEAMSFLAGMTAEDTYTYSLSDELWALGVMLYWLLTDVLPFGTRNEPGLGARIRLESPPHPCIVNPRLPEAASRLCLRMLEKDPGARFQTHDEICGAVEALLSAHEGDASWDVPLIDPESPHHAPTVEGPDADKPRNEQEKLVRQWIVEKPRRGRFLMEGEPLALPALGKLPPVGVLEGQAKDPLDVPPMEVAPKGKQEGAAAAPTLEVPGAPVGGGGGPREHALAAARAAVEPVREGASSGMRRWRVGTGGLLPVGPLLLDLLKRPPLALLAALAVVAFAVDLMGAWHWGAPAWETTPAPLAERVAPPPTTASTRNGETGGAAPIREVAQPGNPAEATRSAAPVRAQPPAPIPTAMLRKKDPRLKPEEKVTPEPQGKMSHCITIPQRVCTAAGVCSIILTGCPGAEVRPTPASVGCPAGWEEAHKRLGIDYGGYGAPVVLQGYKGEPEERAPVREGSVSVVLWSHMGKLPRGALLHGKWQPGESRFYGTFTQAQIPGGDAYPVCLVVGQVGQAAMPDGSVCPPGLGFCPTSESRPGNVKALPRFSVHPKGSF